MMTYLLIGLGSALGGMSRYWLNGLISNAIGQTFPWGTLVINLTGSLAIGFFAALTGPDGAWLVPGGGRLFFMVGVCGGYTTFSSFSLQTLSLLQDGEVLWGVGNILFSLALCLTGAGLGQAAAGLFTP